MRRSPHAVDHYRLTRPGEGEPIGWIWSTAGSPSAVTRLAGASSSRVCPRFRRGLR